MNRNPSLKILDPFAVPRPEEERILPWVRDLSEPLDLRGAPSMVETADGKILLSAQLAARAPWLAPLAAMVERDLRLQLALGRPWVALQPRLLLGPPGAGKSHWARLLARLAGCGHGALDLGGSVDSKGLEGTARSWSNFTVAWPVAICATTRCANPILVVDELNRAGGSDRHGRAADVLLGLIEPSTAKFFPDQALQAPVDLSQCSWIFTANSAENIPRPLLSRMSVVEVIGPGPEHADTIVDVISAELAAAWDIPVDALPILPDRVIRILRDVLAEHRSVRAARRLLVTAYGAIIDRPRRLNT